MSSDDIKKYRDLIESIVIETDDKCENGYETVNVGKGSYTRSKCDSYYSCCDCGKEDGESSCGCSGCFSCNACNHCLSDKNS